VLWLVVATATVARVMLAWRYFGFLGGDDVEMLEEAFRRAFGLAYAPWNIRSLLLPDLMVAPVLRALAFVGIHDSGALVLGATGPFIALASLNVVLVYRLASALAHDRAVARAAATLYALHWLPLAFGATVYPRTPAVTCVLLAALALVGAERDAARGLAAGVLLAVAFAARYSDGVFLFPLLPLCLYAGANRAGSLRRALGVAGGFALGAALTAGVYDALTWGRPFASFMALFRLTVVEHISSSRIPVQGPLFYLARVVFWVPPTLLVVLPFAWRERRVRVAWPFLLLPVAVLSLLFHKELRYLQGVVPFLAILGAAGFVAARRRWPRVLVATLFVLTLATEAFGARLLRGKSMAAVTAARAIASEPGVNVVALSQAWAYGDRLFLGNRIEVRDLPVPPTARDLEAAAERADRIAIYRDDLERDASLVGSLARHGFRESRTFAWGESKAVVVFSRE